MSLLASPTLNLLAWPYVGIRHGTTKEKTPPVRDVKVMIIRMSFTEKRFMKMLGK